MSEYIFLNQTKLRITMVLYDKESVSAVDLTDATEVKVAYRKPSGLTGTWSASILNALSGTIYHDVVKLAPADEEINELGNWLMWAKVKFSDSRELPSLAIKVRVVAEGTVDV
jgi:hypothetical protein